jgi:hypothetical protein
MAVSIAELWQGTRISTFIPDLAVWQVSNFPGSQQDWGRRHVSSGVAVALYRPRELCVFGGAIMRPFLPASVVWHYQKLLIRIQKSPPSNAVLMNDSKI